MPHITRSKLNTRDLTLEECIQYATNSAKEDLSSTRNKKSSSEEKLEEQLNSVPRTSEDTLHRNTSSILSSQTKQQSPISTDPVLAHTPVISTSTLTGRSTTSLNMDNVEQFKTFEKDQLDTILILDHTRTDTILLWLSSIEQVFTDLSYKERLWPSLSYDYLDYELQDWYNKSISAFSNDWTKFKTQLGLYINQASALSTRAVNFQLTTTTDHNKSVETQQESSFTNDIKAEEATQKHADQQKTNQILKTVGAFPKFHGGTGAESWLINILKQFRDLDITHEIRLYYVKHIMEDQALSWYFEHEDEFSSFAAFVKLFRAHFIKAPVVTTPVSASHTSCFSTLQSNTTCTTSEQFEGILLPALLEDFLKK
ncbi:unnamed protein product, partial [Didymodactylos carnosus]